MRPYTMRKTILEELGLSPQQEQLNPDVFGSAWSVYFVGSETLRLVWDGKQGWGYLQRATGQAEWVDASPLMTEADLESVPPNHEKISVFRAGVRDFIAAAGRGN